MAYIVLFNPTDNCRYAWRPLALLFGPTTAVLHYNTFSRLCSALVMRILAIPVVAFYEDFGFPIDHEIAREGMRAFVSLAPLLGLGIKMGKKTSIDNDSIYLASRGISPSPNSNIRLIISPSGDRIAKIVSI